MLGLPRDVAARHNIAQQLALDSHHDRDRRGFSRGTFTEATVVFCRAKLDRDFVVQFLENQREQPFSYGAVGGSRGDVPSGYTVDHNQVMLGHGADVFERAKLAIRQWKMFELAWTTLCWPDAPIEKGASVAVLVSHLGFWSVNACRIVYTVNEPERYGFAYGTLPDHGEKGEERFLVNFHAEDLGVWYDILAFSRPSAWARFGYPFTRMLQKRFALESKAAMVRTVLGKN
jgi:uncharacterized protein (UPF0548 family)